MVLFLYDWLIGTNHSYDISKSFLDDSVKYLIISWHMWGHEGKGYGTEEKKVWRKLGIYIYKAQINNMAFKRKKM